MLVCGCNCVQKFIAVFTLPKIRVVFKFPTPFRGKEKRVWRRIAEERERRKKGIGGMVGLGWVGVAVAPEKVY